VDNLTYICSGLKASTTELFQLSEESSERTSRSEKEMEEMRAAMEDSKKMANKDRKRLDTLGQMSVSACNTLSGFRLVNSGFIFYYRTTIVFRPAERQKKLCPHFAVYVFIRIVISFQTNAQCFACRKMLVSMI
jgi:hypothetical protein